MPRLLLIAAVAALAAVAVAGLGGSADGMRVSGKVKPGSYGSVEIGDSAGSLREDGLIGRLKPGCELDIGQKVAALRPPLEGTAIFSNGKRVTTLVVEGRGPTARGIEVGSYASAARAAYPNADYDPPGSVEPFIEGFIWVNRERNPRMTFVIEQKHHRVLQIAIPAPSFCE